MIQAIRHLRFLAIWEGISFLVLLLIAMPLKYGMGMAWAVRIAGALHGILFVLYVLAVFRAASLCKWSLFRTLEALALSLFPIGTFFLERRLKREEDALTKPEGEECTKS